MEPALIQTLLDYNTWATERILNAAQPLSAEEFGAPGSLSHGGLRGTLLHTLNAEIIWRSRLQGKQPPFSLFAAEDFPNPTTMKTAWTAENQVLQSYVQTLDEAALQQTIHYKNSKGITFENEAWKSLVHLVNHGTQHRAEAAILLTDAGHSPGDIDMILYFRQKAGQR